MTRFATLLDGLAASLDEAAGAFEKGAHWRAALLWPDPDRQFTPVHDRLRAGLATRGVSLYQLGPYEPARGVGPAIWLRCLLDATLDASPPAEPCQCSCLPDISTADLKHRKRLRSCCAPWRSSVSW